MKFLKKLIIFLLLFILLLTAALWILSKTIKPQWVKTYLNEKITASTGMETQINGDIAWQAFPTPGIYVQDIQIGQGGGERTIHVNELELLLQVKPLMHNQLVFNTIKINGMQVNWNLNALPADNKKSQTTVNASTVSTQEKPPRKTTISINQFQLSDGEIAMSDLKKKVKLSGIDLKISQFNLTSKKFPLKLNTQLSYHQPKLNVKTDIKYQGETSIDFNLFQTKDIFSAIFATGELNLNQAKINELLIEHIAASVDLHKKNLKLSPITLLAYGGKGVGHLTYQLNNGNLTLEQSITRLNASKIIEELLGRQIIKGRLDLTINASTNLKSDDLFLVSQAKGNASIKDGALLFIDLDAFIQTLGNKYATLLNSPKKLNIASVFSSIGISEYQGDGTTPFKILSMGFNKNKTAIVENHLLLQTQKIEMQAQGRINLNLLTIDNEGRLKFQTNSKKLGQFMSLFDNGIPLLINGPLTKPHIYPNVQEISLVLSKYYLKKSLNKPVDKLKDEFNKLLSR